MVHTNSKKAHVRPILSIFNVCWTEKMYEGPGMKLCLYHLVGTVGSTKYRGCCWIFLTSWPTVSWKLKISFYTKFIPKNECIKIFVLSTLLIWMAVSRQILDQSRCLSFLMNIVPEIWKHVLYRTSFFCLWHEMKYLVQKMSFWKAGINSQNRIMPWRQHYEHHKMIHFMFCYLVIPSNRGGESRFLPFSMLAMSQRITIAQQLKQVDNCNIYFVSCLIL